MVYSRFRIKPARCRASSRETPNASRSAGRLSFSSIISPPLSSSRSLPAVERFRLLDGDLDQALVAGLIFRQDP